MLINKIERLRKTVARDQPWLADRAAEWDSLTVASWIRKQTGMTDVQAMLEPAMRTIFGADSGELSMLHALHYINSCGGLMPLIEIEGGFQERRIDGGAQQVCERLADSVGRDRVLTGVPVREIQQGDRVVTITAGDRSFTARAAIVSVPLAIVDRIHFSSALPVLRSQLTQRVSAGATVKVLLTYERPFWRDQGLSGEAVSTSGPVSVVFDNCSKDDRQAALLAFVVGDPARGWSDQPDQVRQQTVLAFLEKCFGPEVHSYSSLVETDWAAEQWSGGCPTNNYPPGTLSTFGPALRAPAGRIYWAGTETARINTGYMDGAIESGLRAAEEVAVSLGRLGTK